MPVSWTISQGFVYVVSDEHWTLEEWMTSVDALLADPRYEPGMGLLHDRRRTARTPFSQEVRAAVDFIRARADALGKARWGLVVEGLAGYGMGRMAEALIDGSSIELRVFRDLAVAEAWVRGRG